ncbi:MAG: hypothetical protein AB1626_01530 [Candidatus Micrarchaeota archaeon]
MKEITIAELIRKANEFEKHGKKWHFHILLPGCKFNKKKDVHSFILENESGNQYFVTYSKKRYLSEGAELVKLLYGETILEKPTSVTSGSKEINYMLGKAQAHNKNKRQWEHHLLFPNCILNKNKGKWVNVFEDEEEVVESITTYEPVDDLKRIEILHYAQKR